MRQTSYVNGVYGLNLTSLLISYGNSKLLERIESFIEVLDNGGREFEGKSIGHLFSVSGDSLILHSDLAYSFFYDDIRNFLYENCKISIPDLNESFDPESNTLLFFSIYQIHSEADTSGMDEGSDESQAEELDYIIGIPLFAFPNSIKLSNTFTTYADWFLWVIYA